MASLFRRPDEALLEPLLQRFPGRHDQIRSLAALVHPDAAPCRNLVLHGPEATGKTAIAEQLLAQLCAGDDDDDDDDGGGRLGYAVVKAAQCVTARHLLERVVGAVADALPGDAADPRLRRCETLAQLAVALATMLGAAARDPPGRRFVLVLDAIDGQRDAPPTLLPALARLGETVPCLSCVFIVTAPPAGFLRTAAAAHLYFPPYTKAEFVAILSLAPPAPIPGATQRETHALWARFCAAVHDAFVRAASRTLPAFRHSCRALWPRFTAPVLAGTHTARDFSRLLVAARGHFQDESLLNPGLVALGAAPRPAAAELAGLLPVAARLLLVAAYLASHNASRHDLTLFSTRHHGRRRRRAGAAARPQHRKIARKLLGAHAFVLERMLAIFEAVRREWLPEGTSVGVAGVDGDVAMALATLASLRLLVRVGAGHVTDRAGKWRITLGWDTIRGIGRSIGVEVQEWLVE